MVGVPAGPTRVRLPFRTKYTDSVVFRRRREGCWQMGASRTRTATRAARQVLVPGGATTIGSAEHYPEEAPVRSVVVRDLWVDEHPVTNAEFRRFVTDTGHRTTAELAPEPVPGEPAEDLQPGSLVFAPPAGPV